MNRAEYMRVLQRRLKRLPGEDYDRAVSYFEEYFEDAGPEHEAEAIEDLGRPEMAADEVIRSMAVENAQKPEKDVKRGLSKVWVGILAVCAAPVGLPLAVASAAVIVAIFVVIAALLFTVFAVALSVAVSSVPCIILSIWFLFTVPTNGVATLGLGLLGLGIGIWFVMACVDLCKGFLNLMMRLSGRIAKGGKKCEK